MLALVAVVQVPQAPEPITVAAVVPVMAVSLVAGPAFWVEMVETPAQTEFSRAVVEVDLPIPQAEKAETAK